MWTFAWTISMYLLYKIYNSAIIRGTKRYTGISGNSGERQHYILTIVSFQGTEKCLDTLTGIFSEALRSQLGKIFYCGR